MNTPHTFCSNVAPSAFLTLVIALPHGQQAKPFNIHATADADAPLFPFSWRESVELSLNLLRFEVRSFMLCSERVSILCVLQ